MASYLLRMHPLAELWTWFADTSCAGYSPLYDRIARAVAASPEMIDLISEAPPSGHQPTVLLASVHYLLLDGLDHPLTAVYAGTSDADPGPLFVDVCLRHRSRVLELLATRHTNTNEVGRSAVLGPALTTVADELGSPLALVDVGCSAGLNLLCDKYLLDYGPAGTTGPPAAAVRISCEVIGGRPPIASALPSIDARVGIDRDPVDATDDDDVRWQLACVWPDTGRLPRTRLALEAAKQTPLHLVRGDAVESVAGAVLGLPADVVPVVTTTWAAAYFPKRERVAFREAIAAASRERPVAWISAEGPGVIDLFADVEVTPDAQGLEPSVLGLVVFRDGAPDARLLALVHPHGTWIDWRA
jgi:hypothetical protein